MDSSWTWTTRNECTESGNGLKRLFNVSMNEKQTDPKKLLCKITCKNRAFHIYLFSLFFDVAWMVRHCFYKCHSQRRSLCILDLYSLFYYIQCCFISLFFHPLPGKNWQSTDSNTDYFLHFYWIQNKVISRQQLYHLKKKGGRRRREREKEGKRKRERGRESESERSQKDGWATNYFFRDTW